jgi:hypothetical protein
MSDVCAFLIYLGRKTNDKYIVNYDCNASQIYNNAVNRNASMEVFEKSTSAPNHTKTFYTMYSTFR